MKLLTVENAKTVKGEDLGYLTGILYLAPSDESGVLNVCPKATAGCKADCLFTAGRGAFESVRAARIRKTKVLAQDRELFLSFILEDIDKLVAKAKRINMIPAIRLNGTSDLPALAMRAAKFFPKVQFYDYTKIPKPWLRTFPNYHLTFSRSESNETDCKAALTHGINVAVVFDVLRGRPLPEEWQGYKVIDGDLHDLRFLDPSPRIVGLRAKGRARKERTSGFVVIADF